MDSGILVSGFILGLSGGLSPGPLLTLVISESLRHGILAGIRISLAPLITDIPIILITFGLLSKMSNLMIIIGAISLAGSIYLFILGWKSIRFKGEDMNPIGVADQALKKGIIANFLNPSPYLFWISVGSPILLNAIHTNMVTAVGFIFVFYIMLVGSKIAVATLTAKSQRFLKSAHYIYTMRGLGLVLIVFALIFLKKGLTQLAIL